MLTFIKRTATSWQHDNGTVKSSFGGGIPITNDTENTIVFQLPNGTNFPIKAQLIPDCKIIDKTDGDAEYTFSTTTEFLDKLEELNYPFINTGGRGGGVAYTDTTFAQFMETLDAETEIDDADLLNFTDDSQTKQKVITWSNFKGYLKEYLDTVYATASAVATAIGEALTTAETYTDNALEDYTNTTDLNTLLGTKADKSSWVDYSATSTISGWSAFTTKEVFIKQEDKGCWVKIKIEGTSTTGTTSCTLNFNADESKRSFTISRNVGTYGSGVVDTASGSNVLTFYNTVSGGAYTTSGTKLVDVTLFIKKV